MSRGGRGLGRRDFVRLTGGLGLGFVAAGCAKERGATAPLPSGAPTGTPGVTATPTSAADLLRPGTAAGTITAHPLQLDLAGRVVDTWGYNGTVPGPEIRVKQGEVVRVRLDNRIPDPTTIHWHGIELPNPMDGVPDVTQPAVGPGGDFSYEFTVPDAGSFMYHAHVGHQFDFGMYGPLVVEEKDSPGRWDREYVVMLDDWRDGLTPLGEQPAAADSGHGEEGAEALSDPEDAARGGGEAKNPGAAMGARLYPLFLVNGRPAADPATFDTRAGDRIRLRVMNIAADTGFTFAIAGHRLTVTHADGFPVEEVTVDTIRLGMGERYDVLVEARNPGAWQIAAVPEGKRGLGRAVLRYTDSPGATPPAPDARPAELKGRLLDYADLRYTGEKDFGGAKEPDRVHDLVIETNRINGRRYPGADPLTVAQGETVRFNMRNDSDLWHPMHLHGHSFRVRTAAGPGAVKDTLSVASNGGTASFDFIARNPGAWMFHCHNHYHMDNGMARLVTYS